MNEPDNKCKREINDGPGWRWHQCDNAAVTEAGFCRVHDPDLQAERAKKRGPSKFERALAAKRAVDEFVDQLPAEQGDRMRSLIHMERMLSR